MDSWRLKKETDAAQRLRERIVLEYGDDAELIRDMVEGETDLHKMIGWATEELAAVEGEKDGMELAIGKLKERLTRHCRRADAIREGLATAMDAAELTSLKTPCATLSMRASPPRVEVPDAMELPEEFIKWTAAPDKKAIAAALKDGATVTGASLSNQPPALSVRFT